ncbi:uncharacterized protein [Populus alba]|uniref:uncharacterized protein n=1 Tax=Populus alba TaxID=43335 RepID=UPI003CC70407
MNDIDQMMHHSGLGPAPLEAFVKVPKFLRVLILKFIVQVSGCLVIKRIWPRKLSLNCSQRMVRLVYDAFVLAGI